MKSMLQGCTAVAFAWLASATSWALPSSYEVTEIARLDDPNIKSVLCTAVNEFGQAVGYQQTDLTYLPFITGRNGIGVNDIMAMGRPYWLIHEAGQAQGVNSNAEVAGLGGPNHYRAFMTGMDGAGIKKLSGIGNASSGAIGINNAGQVTGWMDTPSGEHAFAWSRRSGLKDLGTLGGAMSFGKAINSTGQIVGWSSLPGEAAIHAMFYDPSTAQLTDLGTMPGYGADSYAYGISDAGKIVVAAFATHDDTWPRAFLTEANHTPPQDLGTLGGNYSRPFAINAAGIVVGTSQTNVDWHAFVYDPSVGKMVDLNSLISGLPGGGYLDQAFGISSAGQVCAQSGSRAFLLSPSARHARSD